MYQRTAGARFLEVFLFAVASLVLYHVGVGIGFFLIPLQVVASRRGERSLLAACGIFLLVFLALRCVPFLGGSLPPDILSGVEAGGVVLLLLGVVAVNLSVARRHRVLYWLLGASGAAGIIAFPALAWLSRTPEFQRSMTELYGAVSRIFTSLFATRDGMEDSLAAALLSPESLRRMSEAYLSRTLLAIYFALLSFSWWAGQMSARRAQSGAERLPFHFARFHLEAFWLWPLIASCGVILADLYFHIAAWSLVAWNIGLVLVFLYGLQGLAILRFLFEKHGLPRILWLLLVALVIGLAASPRAGLFVAVALPAFGVSENWIRYRVPRSAQPTEQE
ncbi:MAG TPA: DUF2232 domain-containing protein [Spirochaetia bacterium]|nr:DUF2232 domain-containing protein [Spirochaetia bacterium]